MDPDAASQEHLSWPALAGFQGSAGNAGRRDTCTWERRTVGYQLTCDGSIRTMESRQIGVARAELLERESTESGDKNGET